MNSESSTDEEGICAVLVSCKVIMLGFYFVCLSLKYFHYVDQVDLKLMREIPPVSVSQVLGIKDMCCHV